MARKTLLAAVACVALAGCKTEEQKRREAERQQAVLVLAFLAAGAVGVGYLWIVATRPDLAAQLHRQSHERKMRNRELAERAAGPVARAAGRLVLDALRKKYG